MAEDLFFEVTTPLGYSVRITRAYWELIVAIKHPVMNGREAEVQKTLRDPDEIRRSKIDPSVHLFYRAERSNRWTCVVVKQLNGRGFVITTFPTDAIKEGKRIWSK